MFIFVQGTLKSLGYEWVRLGYEINLQSVKVNDEYN